MANNKIKVIEGYYPVTVLDAVKVGDGTSKSLKDMIDSGEIGSSTGDNYWNGKKAVIIGDSFSDPSNSHPKWYPYLTSMLGIQILRNYSIGGYRICPLKYDTDLVDGASDTYSHLYNNKYQTYDYNGADIVIICTAINDFFSSCPFDDVKGAYQTAYTPEEERPNRNTFTGAYEIILADIMKRGTTSTQKTPLVVMCTPTNNRTMPGYKNPRGLTVEDYSRNIHDIAYAWGCAVCDWTKGSMFNSETVYSNTREILGVASDSCHPNEYGALRLGRMTANTISLY